MKTMSGVINAMTTPFTSDNGIDVDSLKRQVDFLISKGVDCLYPLGTTGEMYLLDSNERKLVAKTVVDQAKHRVKVFIHVGAMTTKEACDLAKHAESIGADGIGAVTPSYFGCSDRAIIQYYRDIASAVSEDFPVYLYSIPQCSGNDIKPEVAAKIADDCQNVVGIKYSYPDMIRILDYLKIKNGEFSVLVGPDKLFVASLVCGAKGVVSGVAGPMPEVFVSVYKAYLDGDIALAAKLQKTACEVIELLKGGSDMAIFKEVLRRRGIVSNSLMRRPLLELPENEADAIWEQCQKYL